MDLAALEERAVLEERAALEEMAALEPESVLLCATEKIWIPLAAY